MEQVRDNQNLKMRIDKQDQKFDKMKQRIKESELNLNQIRIDDNCMRRDLACFDASFEEVFDVSSQCEDMVGTIEQRTHRLQRILER
mmetsp:Transcript_19930/g.23606  ORF Transcript_19930/g.23606 Transcript_19930/m.23606 type:complete len:87 (+) Transcript_19930:1-261(+)